MEKPFEKNVLEEQIQIKQTKNELLEKSELLSDLRKRYEVYPNAEEKFNMTLKNNGYEMITELENGENYLTLDSWINNELLSGNWVRNYPCFVRNINTGEILFCKTRIKPHENWGGLEQEAVVLNNLPKEIKTPRVIKYLSEDDENLEAIFLQAIKVSEGRVLPMMQWQTQHAKQAVDNIMTIESFEIEKFAEFQQQPLITIESLLDRCQGVVNLDYQNKVNYVLSQYEDHSRCVLVHGDTWTRNMIVSSNKQEAEITFIDWERAGAGYIGQDAGRIAWELFENNNCNQAAIEQYCNHGNKELQKTILNFGIVFESLRWIADRNDQIKNNVDQEKAIQLLKEIDDVESKALRMLEMLDKI